MKELDEYQTGSDTKRRERKTTNPPKASFWILDFYFRGKTAYFNNNNDGKDLEQEVLPFMTHWHISCGLLLL